MQDYEQLGSFYLGSGYDLLERKRRPELVLYDSRHLTTHALCVGMTGSGKTGLCIGLLEEAAIDGVPAIVIDPKGDIANLLLSFPAGAPADFLPWVDAEEAARQGLSPAAFAEKVAASHAAGLAEWGQDVTRIQRFRDACDLTIYTPGSSTGEELSLLRSFEAPDAAVLEDAELFAGKVEGTVSGLLGLVGVQADAMRSREHVLLSQILSQAWAAGRSLDLAGIIGAVQDPPFDRVGVIELETFYPKKERAELAVAVNALLASPAAAGWARGEALDVARLLRTVDGKPRVSIISIAHLSDAQRMFFVTLLLDEVLSWMRRQSGTSSLRALLYMDEIFGYFPPTAAPPSKRPMLTLLKQARAFGLGVVLATQNPMDLDYKGLSNCGTWFLGRLQTERDKLRVLEGLEGAALGANQAFDRSAMDQVLSALGSRVFLMNDVREPGPLIFQTRHTLSFLRGPLSRDQIKLLMDPKKKQLTAAPQPVAKTVEMAAASSTAAGNARPSVPEGLPEAFVSAGGQGPVSYQPAIGVTAKLHFVDAKAGVDTWRHLAILVPLAEQTLDLDFSVGTAVNPALLLTAAHEPLAGATFLPLPKRAPTVKQLTSWKKSFVTHLYQQQRVELLACPALELTARADESPAAFRARVDQAARESRDEEVEALRAKYDPKFKQMQTKLDAIDAKLAREQAESSAKQVDTAAAFGGAVLGALLGRSAVSATTVRRGASVVQSAGRAKKEAGDVARTLQQRALLHEKWAALQAEANAQLAALQSKVPGPGLELTRAQVSPRKADTDVGTLTLVWLPFRRDPAGNPAWAFSWT
jgi:Type IV secretion-system coupling protein DNA-binding domain